MGKLTNKQDLFAKHYAMGKSGKQAAILAGYSKRSAQVIASENLTKPEVLKKVESILNAAGLSDGALAKRLQKAIDAGLGKRPSNSDALKGIRMALELKDRFPDTHTRMEVTQTSEVELKLSKMTTEELEDYLEEISIKTQGYLEDIKKRRAERAKTSQPETATQKVAEGDGVMVPKAVGVPSTRPSNMSAG